MNDSSAQSSNRSIEGRDTIGELLEKRLSRREFVVSSARGIAVTMSTSVLPVLGCTTAESREETFAFAELPTTADEFDHVATGYEKNIILRWGDPLHDGIPEFDPKILTADDQEKRFGYNNDYIGIVELPPDKEIERIVLCVNHESPVGRLMFPGVLNLNDMTADYCEVEKASLGVSVVEIQKREGLWRANRASILNRRISARSTAFEVCGPARGSTRLATEVDPTGTQVVGTMRNCAGGVTPWKTYLSAEENIDTAFDGTVDGDHPEFANHKRMGMPGVEFAWGRFDERFDLSKTPNEPNRFGWVVEIDPLDPSATPKKRTALGRFMHEGAEPIVAPDGRIVVYMGDDSEFEYIYKFVTDDPWDPQQPDRNKDLLDRGTLYVAKFSEDGTLDWLPLTFGEAPLIPKMGFHSQADVLIETRRAADLLGATPLDRPESVRPNPRTGRVYAMCTKNPSRKNRGIASAVPNNRFGHIIELIEPDGDFAATRSTWDVLVQCGDPNAPGSQTTWHSSVTDAGWFSCPDNVAIDYDNRLWVATDQGSAWAENGRTDGIWVVETEGNQRGLAKHFYSAPVGAEVTGPQFTSDQKTLFLSVQHPGADGVERFRARNRPSIFSDPATRWPDFTDEMPPRPSVVALTHKRGKPIGSAA